MPNKRRGFPRLVLLIFALTLFAGLFAVAFADDPTAATSAASGAIQMLPAHTPAVVAATVPATAPATQQAPQFSLPAQHDAMSILIWVFITLIPCLGWFVDTIMPFLPCKANGILHGFILMFKAPTVDPQTNTVTVQLNEIKEAIAAIKGGTASGPGA